MVLRRGATAKTMFFVLHGAVDINADQTARASSSSAQCAVGDTFGGHGGLAAAYFTAQGHTALLTLQAAQANELLIMLQRPPTIDPDTHANNGTLPQKQKQVHCLL